MINFNSIFLSQLEPFEPQFQAILAPFSTWKCGGPADILVIAKNATDLEKLVILAIENEVAYTILGHASNVLISDRGIRGLVIINKSREVKIVEKNDFKESSIEKSNLQTYKLNVIFDIYGVILRDNLLDNEIGETSDFIKNNHQTYDFYYLSNITKDQFEKFQQLDIFKFFKGGLASFQSKFEKPSTEFFHELIVKYNLPKDQCLFIDDSDRNVQAAQELHIDGIIYSYQTVLPKRVEKWAFKKNSEQNAQPSTQFAPSQLENENLLKNQSEFDWRIKLDLPFLKEFLTECFGSDFDIYFDKGSDIANINFFLQEFLKSYLSEKLETLPKLIEQIDTLLVYYPKEKIEDLLSSLRITNGLAFFKLPNYYQFVKALQINLKFKEYYTRTNNGQNRFPETMSTEKGWQPSWDEGFVKENQAKITLQSEKLDQNKELVQEAQNYDIYITPRHSETGDPNFYSFADLDYDESLDENGQKVNLQKTTVVLDSGVDLSYAIAWSLSNNLTGLQWFAGIPGTVGGALYNNIHGGTRHFSDNFVSCKVLIPESESKSENLPNSNDALT